MDQSRIHLGGRLQTTLTYYLWLPFPVPMVELEGVEVTEHIDESELLSLLILLAETAAVHVDNKDFSRLQYKRIVVLNER